jgi:hypothetical protein
MVLIGVGKLKGFEKDSILRLRFRFTILLFRQPPTASPPVCPL